ncbi:hybrid-cluster NAD(P)-dependent oxidoreductase [Ancylobacter amanitiformis]|uniref:Ferredoxin-NADP reductase n=1 Tax=Ancylobacter amanitiformis TaxID=217069 RepID=A0ABU0LU80_9HYPH|nr:hybrid-cluster NAD(P)-dependent oxidoreductase [Ancylobacter amanitiformis]MDQ0512269.1 ferredoxin-NADP reductase [Ancylobacter amanitiformis]
MTIDMPAGTAGLRLTCIDIRPETPGVKTFRFRAGEGVAVSVVPGQAMMLAIELAGERHWRSFSISGAGADGTVEMTIKAQAPGGATHWLHERLAPGMTLPARAARGAFTLAARSGGPVAFISAGSGVTPLIAMLRELARTDPEADVAWVHAARREDDILFAPALADLQLRMPNLAASITVSHPGAGWFGYRGRVNRRLMSVMVPDFAVREVFCCGPAAFMQEVRLIHAAEGGRKERFYTERFHTERFHTESGGVAAPAIPAEVSASGNPAGDFHLRAAGRELAIRADETVLQASLRQGVIIPCGCGEGLCGTCMVKLDRGSVALRHHGGITPEEEAEGYILACSSWPVTDLAITIG